MSATVSRSRYHRQRSRSGPVHVTVFSSCRVSARSAEPEPGLWRFGECRVGCIAASSVVQPACAGVPAADPAGAPSRLVPPSEAAREPTTQDGLQVTHGTPTGTGSAPLPAATALQTEIWRRGTPVAGTGGAGCERERRLGPTGAGGGRWRSGVAGRSVGAQSSADVSG